MVLPQGALDGLQCVIVVFPDHTIFLGSLHEAQQGFGEQGRRAFISWEPRTEGQILRGQWNKDNTWEQDTLEKC